MILTYFNKILYSALNKFNDLLILYPKIKLLESFYINTSLF